MMCGGTGFGLQAVAYPMGWMIFVLGLRVGPEIGRFFHFGLWVVRFGPISCVGWCFSAFCIRDIAPVDLHFLGGWGWGVNQHHGSMVMRSVFGRVGWWDWVLEPSYILLVIYNNTCNSV